MRRVVNAGLLLAAIGLPAMAQAAPVEVRFSGAAPGGPILAQLCTEAEFDGACELSATVQPDAQGDAVVRFDAPAGVYALRAYQDVNRDGRLNFNIMGAPSEPWGYSRGARGVFGPPEFGDAAVRTAEAGSTITVVLGR